MTNIESRCCVLNEGEGMDNWLEEINRCRKGLPEHAHEVLLFAHKSRYDRLKQVDAAEAEAVGCPSFPGMRLDRMDHLRENIGFMVAVKPVEYGAQMKLDDETLDAVEGGVDDVEIGFRFDSGGRCSARIIRRSRFQPLDSWPGR